MNTQKAREILQTEFPMFFSEIESYLSFENIESFKTEQDLVDDFTEFLEK
jgi:hypothetical protein